MSIFDAFASRRIFVSVGAASPDEFYDAYTFNVERRGLWARAFRRFFRHRLAAASLFLFVLVFGAGLLASHLAPYGYQEVNIRALSAAPSWAHPFGTDQFGRDYFSRVLYGLGTEARVALGVALFGTVIGTLIGALGGYYGGVLDNLLMRGTDLVLTLPPLITLLVAVSYLQATTLLEVSFLIAAVMWMPLARVVRSTCFSVREKEYVDAARAMGASDLRIIARHILPNAMSSVAVAATVMAAGAIVLETTMSYLGRGITDVRHTESQTGSLGDVMFVAGQEGLFHWWGILFPALAVIFMIVPIYFVGDGIRDALDPVERRYVRSPGRSRVARAVARAFRVYRLVPAPARVGVIRVLQSMRAGGAEAMRPLHQLAASAAHFRATVGEVVTGWMPRRRRARSPRARLLVEALVVVAVTAGAAGAIYVWKVNPKSSSWAVAGTHVIDVSRAPGAQTEASLAVDPSNPTVLFAASNDSLERTIRVYESADGGRNWSSKLGPALPSDACAQGEPSVTVTPDGREFVAFTVSAFCLREDVAPYLVIASRAGPNGRWTVRRIAARPRSELFDAMPALASDAVGRVYVAWSRRMTLTSATTVISTTTDHGRHWSRPHVVSRKLEHPHLVRATVNERGTLFLTGIDARYGVWVARSADHGATFALGRVGPLRFESWNNPKTCATVGQNYPTAFEAVTCIGPNPTVTASGKRVYVTYAASDQTGTQHVMTVTFDSHLRVLWRARPGRGGDANAEQLYPTSAGDPRTGNVWVCFYDTSGEPSRKRTWFSCTHSPDGRTWTTPVRTGSAAASVEVLIEDARAYGFQDPAFYGEYTALAVVGGLAHPMWTDTQDLQGRKQEIFAASLR